MGRMSDLDISRHELGQAGAEAEILEEISKAFARLAVLRRGAEGEPSADLLTDTYETDESIEAKTAAGVDVEAEVKRQRQGTPTAKAKTEKKEAKPKTPTLEEVRAELTAYARKGFSKDIREIIVGFGANRLSELKPEHYAEVLERMRDIADGRH